MKFIFRLERLLELRARAEDERKQRLAKAVLAVRAATEAVERTESAQQDLARSWREAVALGLCAADAEDYLLCSAALERELSARKKSVQQAETAVAARQADLEAANSKRRSLEKFKEKAKRRFTLIEQVVEQKLFDEMALLRAGGRP